MGGLTAFRNHLFNLFPRAFVRNIPKTRFCMVVLDVMQFLASHVKHKKPGEPLCADSVATSTRSVAESYIYSTEYSATKAFVMLLDTPKNVPTNKAGTQRKRDNKEDEEEAEEEEGDDKEETKTTTRKRKIFDKAFYEELCATAGSSEALEKLGRLLECPELDGDTIWRSNNLKFQLYCRITDELLKIVPPGSLELVLDDGIAVHPDLYMQRRKEMITHYAFQDRHPYDQEILVSSLARHHFTERFVVSQKRGIERLPQTKVGEADVKIPRFIVKGNGTKRYLVVSQDTDIIFILLLHLKRLLPFEDGLEVWLDTQTPKDRRMGLSHPYRFINVIALYNAIIELFEREYPEVKNPIETVVLLAYSRETDFTAGFDSSLRVSDATIWNTFSALHTPEEVMRERGYVLFNTNGFDELAIVGNIKKEQTRERDAAKIGMKRSEKMPFCPYPSKWVGILKEAVVYGYDLLQDRYEIEVDDVACQSFYYLVCQLKILNDLDALGFSQFSKKKKNVLQNHQRTYITTCDELFMWTGEIEAKLEAHRLSTLANAKEEESKKRKAEIAMSTAISPKKEEEEPQSKKAKLMPKMLQPKKKEPARKVITCNFAQMDKHFSAPSLSSSASSFIDDIIEEIDEKESELKQSSTKKQVSLLDATKTSVVIRRKMDEMLKRKKEGTFPKDYNLPRLDGMLSYVYQRAYLMNNHQNAWTDTTEEYMTKFSDASLVDHALSCHGWKAREIEQTQEALDRGDFNSSYFTSVFVEGIHPGVVPFRVFQMTATDQVFNRNHAAYLG